MKLNTPNKLTISRMIITPIFLAVFLWEGLPHRFLFAAAVFALGAITDALDGNLARKNNQITVFGKLLDPVADKMLTTAALLAFMKLGYCSIWIVMIVLTREFAVTSVRLVASAQGVVIPANIWGKLKTASQMTFTILIMLLAEAQYVITDVLHSNILSGLPSYLSLQNISNALLWITAALAVVSGVIYFVKSKDLIDFSK